MAQVATHDDSPLVKPRLRGVSHQIAFFIALAAGVLLVVGAPSSHAAFAAAIYGASLATLLGTSALYHRRNWSPSRREILRRFDHSAIFVLIAGSYTPACRLAMEPAEGHPLLIVIWSGAVAGIAISVGWPRAPRALKTLLYAALGWVGVVSAPALQRSMGTSGLVLFVGGGVIYSVGAVVYVKKRPNPWPATFGYHEIFHLLVIAAATCHFVAFARFILKSPG